MQSERTLVSSSLSPHSLAEVTHCRRYPKQLAFGILQCKFSLLQLVSIAPCLCVCTFVQSLAPSCLYHSWNHKTEIAEDDSPVASALLQHPRTFCSALGNGITLHPLKFDSFPHLFSRGRGQPYAALFVLVVQRVFALFMSVFVRSIVSVAHWPPDLNLHDLKCQRQCFL